MSAQREARLLVIDDEESNRDVLSRRLARAGFAVETAPSGEAGLARIAAGGVDLVLLDYTMPEMDGCEVLRRIRARHSLSELPVIMATSRDGRDDMLAALAAGANDYVTKPIDLEVARARIRTQIALRENERAVRESQARYELATLGANDGLWDWDLAANHMHLSARWCAMAGMPAAAREENPEFWLARVHAADAFAVRAAVRSHVEGIAAQLEVEYRLIAEDGTCRWMLARGVAARDDRGRAIRMAGSQTDLTRHKAIDAETDLGSRVLLLDRIERAQTECARDAHAQFSLLHVRVERFATLAATLEPAALSRYVRTAAERVVALARANDTVCSLGGGRFAVLTARAADAPETQETARDIARSLARPVELGRAVRESAAAVGIVACGASGEPEELLRDADLASSSAQALRGRVQLFDAQLRESAARREALEAGLRETTLETQLELHYQPIVSIERGHVLGFESLVRWRRDGALISPGEFIPIAEEIGAIGRIGAWALAEACREAAAWPRLPNGERAFVSVNVSPHQLREDESLRGVEEALRASGLPPEALKLEITETALFEDAEAAARALSRLRSLGVRLCLDDFGTGYSSLQQLQLLPIDIVKIDRCFVSKLCGDRESATMVAMILDLARNLSMEVVAEGIETETQRDQLAELGCALGQGFLFSKPVPADRVLAWIHGTARAGEPS